MATILGPSNEEYRFIHSIDLSSPSPDIVSPSSPEDTISTPMARIYNWNVRHCCVSMPPIFQYISRKLAQQGFHIALLVTAHTPELLPIWPINHNAQSFLSKVVRKAYKKHMMYKKHVMSDSWVNALTSLCEHIEPGLAFEKHREKSYLIHRSLIQHDILFSGDGLTVLSVDRIYTFKSFLEVSSKKHWPLGSVVSWIDSSVQLLHHINSIYTGTKLCKGYLKRVYQQIRLDDTLLDEVCRAYQQAFGEAPLVEMKQRELSRSTPYSPDHKHSDHPTEPWISRDPMELTGLQWPATPVTQAMGSQRQEDKKRLVSSHSLPKLVTKDLQMIGAKEDSARDPEGYYLSKYHENSPDNSSLSARPSSKTRSAGQLRSPQSARLPSRSRARLGDPSSSAGYCPLGISGVPSVPLGDLLAPFPCDYSTLNSWGSSAKE